MQDEVRQSSGQSYGGQGQGRRGAGFTDAAGAARRRAPWPRRQRRRTCAWCSDGTTAIDYKNVSKLRKFLNERGKIMPRRQTGVCAKHQRAMARAIKRARVMALISFVGR